MTRQRPKRRQITMTENNHKPVYCRDCRSAQSFSLYPQADVMTESGRVFMVGYKCRECGKVVIMSNPDYKPPGVTAKVTE